MNAQQAGSQTGELTTSAEAPRRNRWLTPTLWAAGVALQLAAPLLRDRVPLSDDLLITSMLAPVWVFLQLCILAGILRVFRGAAERWSRGVRVGFALAVAVVVALLQPQLITVLMTPRESLPLGKDPVLTALLWSTPLAFYVIPAAIVVVAWLARDPRLTLVRALGIGLVVIGALNFPYILWLTHLWDIYVRPSGGESVLRPVAPLAGLARRLATHDFIWQLTFGRG